jgi:hypothetical protein
VYCGRKLTPSSLFFLPCQAQNPADSFFIDFGDKNRAPLDPYVWAGYCQTLEERIGCERLRGRELTCSIANAGAINAADVTSVLEVD